MFTAKVMQMCLSACWLTKAFLWDHSFSLYILHLLHLKMFGSGIYICFSFQQEFSLTLNSVRPFMFMFYLQGSVAPLTEEISWYGSGRSDVGKSRQRGEACGGQGGPTDDEPPWRRMGLAGGRCMFHCNHLHPCCNQVMLGVCVSVGRAFQLRIFLELVHTFAPAEVFMFPHLPWMCEPQASDI